MYNTRIGYINNVREAIEMEKRAISHNCPEVVARYEAKKKEIAVNLATELAKIRNEIINEIEEAQI